MASADLRFRDLGPLSSQSICRQICEANSQPLAAVGVGLALPSMGDGKPSPYEAMAGQAPRATGLKNGPSPCLLKSYST